MAYAAIAMVCFCWSDAMAKQLADSLSAPEIAWCRYVVTVAAMIPVVCIKPDVLATARLGAQIGRGLGLLGSALFFILALHYLPIAEATSLAFVSPFFVTALSIPLLGERVAAHRWIAAAIGFAGVLIVVRPGAPASGWAIVLPMLCALSWGFGVVLTRRIGNDDGPVTSLLYAGLVGLVTTSAVVAWRFTPLGRAQLVSAFVMAVAWTAAQWFIVLAYRRAPASLLAPLSYTRIVWATLFGYALFGIVPDAWTSCGIAVIVGSEAIPLLVDAARGLSSVQLDTKPYSVIAGERK